MDAIQDTVHQVSMSYLAGRILTIFFKKNFSFTAHYKQVIFDSIAVFVASLIASWLSLYAYLGVSIEILALVYSNSRHIHDEMLKTLALSTSWYVAVHGDLTEATFDNLTLAFATTQFLRKPNELKEYLREIRIVFGPIYVIMMSAGLRFCSFDNINMRCLAILLSVVSSVLAAIFFRPDNNQTLKAILPASKIPSTAHRQLVHGYLMFSSLFVTFLKVLKTAPSLMLAASVFGPLNIILFLTYKMSRQWR
ncbi:uncharacterized protein LOC116308575 [Actinia tenebrosa]|uniref:Uncharacterized protein LOC116308575 n=1 Tax=Actinia tenebrosa TaxID=6105 RepID=A0A6P8JB05_ACTTE|nr:uncharacterized protein LOC116308575 [Actinia tenebrosa]